MFSGFVVMPQGRHTAPGAVATILEPDQGSYPLFGHHCFVEVGVALRGIRDSDTL